MTGNLTQRFGANLRRIRLSQGLTMADLGRKAGISEGDIGVLERGEVSPELETLEALATAMEVEPTRLIADAALNAKRSCYR